MTDDTWTIQRAAKEALAIQNASNLSGVLLAWHKAACAVNGLLLPSTVARTHPVNLLFLSKITSLMGVNADAIGCINTGGYDLMNKAYEACITLAKETL